MPPSWWTVPPPPPAAPPPAKLIDSALRPASCRYVDLENCCIITAMGWYGMEPNNEGDTLPCAVCDVDMVWVRGAWERKHD